MRRWLPLLLLCSACVRPITVPMPIPERPLALGAELRIELTGTGANDDSVVSLVDEDGEEVDTSALIADGALSFAAWLLPPAAGAFTVELDRRGAGDAVDDIVPVEVVAPAGLALGLGGASQRLTAQGGVDTRAVVPVLAGLPLNGFVFVDADAEPLGAWGDYDWAVESDEGLGAFVEGGWIQPEPSWEAGGALVTLGGAQFDLPLVERVEPAQISGDWTLALSVEDGSIWSELLRPDGARVWVAPGGPRLAGLEDEAVAPGLRVTQVDGAPVPWGPCGWEFTLDPGAAEQPLTVCVGQACAEVALPGVGQEVECT